MADSAPKKEKTFVITKDGSSKPDTDVKDGSGKNYPLKILQTTNVALLVTFYAPIIILVAVLTMAFAFQQVQKGVIFLVFSIVTAFFRDLLLSTFQSDPNISKTDDICSMIQYTYGSYGNSTFTMFFIAFSTIYICTPMIINNQINYAILAGFLFYYILDVGIRYKLHCITKIVDVFFNTVLGCIVGILIVAFFYISNTQDLFLFFNEINSTKDMCSMPTKQTFKCSVYKNGELIGMTNTN